MEKIILKGETHMAICEAQEYNRELQAIREKYKYDGEPDVIDNALILTELIKTNKVEFVLMEDFNPKEFGLNNF